VADKQAILDRYNELMMNYSDETADEGAKLQDIIDSQNLWDLDSQVEMAMEACAARRAMRLGRKRCQAARSAAWRSVQLLLRQPDLMLLDEPTNHLDAETIAWLEKHLREYPGAVMIITHDRYFLDNVTGWILELDRGRGIPYEGNYTAYLEAKAKRMKQEGREEASGRRRWRASRNGSRRPKGRQAKSKARIKAYDELVKAAGEGVPVRRRSSFRPGERLGQPGDRGEGLSKGYGDRLLIDDLTFKLPPAALSASSARTAPARRRCSG
jgi:ATPase subunit of ABC transporter with duplicated ATPase domains